jgi:hypothetical protein
VASQNRISVALPVESQDSTDSSPHRALARARVLIPARHSRSRRRTLDLALLRPPLTDAPSAPHRPRPCGSAATLGRRRSTARVRVRLVPRPRNRVSPPDEVAAAVGRLSIGLVLAVSVGGKEFRYSEQQTAGKQQEDCHGSSKKRARSSSVVPPPLPGRPTVSVSHRIVTIVASPTSALL